MKTKLTLLLLVTVGICMAQTDTKSGTNGKRPQHRAHPHAKVCQPSASSLRDLL